MDLPGRFFFSPAGIVSHEREVYSLLCAGGYIRGAPCPGPPRHELPGEQRRRPRARRTRAESKINSVTFRGLIQLL